jgi:cysteine desulfuration protein SufE
MIPTPTTPLADALDTLSQLPDWEQRFGYVIELASELPPMPAADKTDTTRVRGCTSQVWMTTAWKGEGEAGEHAAQLNLALDSDAVLVRGLLALVWLAYQGKTKADAANINLLNLLQPTGLLAHLSPNRRSGFASVVGRLQHIVCE